ncbi:MAG: trigger factor [Actinomyces urogenitalis]|uniref:Trigger factor n=3 Tax=Actinomyces urogenitalis TaxID=103621 RepID=C0W742_9ACTO|nr:trigger factor [Actinomyces urogenitalis]ETJ01691.1 MAG: Trigger factor [Actinomyces urogenitalis DORA_12]EEH65422.1 trigger factor [Actinomyces urogenitalis DSM 15434]KGE98892.1 trigger factor [Actinomyces urogenitalis S6-C4]MDK8236849.1 trigger factor [Actinomyces urogenitalis]MDK8836168.1 trigger factor [Actinomyces urogenitalis]
MKSTVENLDPARIKLTVEVPYEELKPSLDAAYKQIGSQIQVPGFRRGHVPNRVIDQRVGRGSVIQEAVNNKLSDFYREAMTEAGRVPMLQPEIEITELPNVTGEQGGQLVFTAEVTVRPEIEIPELSEIEVTVDSVAVTDEDVDTELDNLRARFGSLKSVKRKAKTGDFVTIDLKAVIDGEEVDSASGVSYEIGKGNMLKGLDTALRGLKTGESATFTTQLAGGPHEGEEAEVTVTAEAVKQRELPEADDDFAQMASEFDTIEELREDLRKQAGERKAGDQAVAARDALLEQLREKIEFELPDGLVDNEIAQHLQAEGKAADDPHADEIREDITTGVRDQIILDVLAEKLQVGVTQDELIEFLIQTAQQYGMEPGQFMQGAQQAGQIPAFVSEIARNKSLAMGLRQVSVKDSDGKDVDLTEFIGSDELDAQNLVSQVAEAAAEDEDKAEENEEA